MADDISQIADWYDENGDHGLGHRFIDTFLTGLHHLRENGHIYRAVYLDFRKILLRPFPYSVFYRLHDEIWIVTLVIHAARSPFNTRSILRERD